MSGVAVGLTGFVLLQAGDKVDAAAAGFSLVFALNIAGGVPLLLSH